MDAEFYNKLLSDIKELKNYSKELDLDLTERVVTRLHSFECGECNIHLGTISEQISTLKEKKNELSKEDIKKYNCP